MTDILARVPNYGIMDVKQRVLEFLLSLETMENEANKSRIKKSIEKINVDWKTLYTKFTNKLKSLGANEEIKVFENVCLVRK